MQLFLKSFTTMALQMPNIFSVVLLWPMHTYQKLWHYLGGGTHWYVSLICNRFSMWPQENQLNSLCLLSPSVKKERSVWATKATIRLNILVTIGLHKVILFGWFAFDIGWFVKENFRNHSCDQTYFYDIL